MRSNLGLLAAVTFGTSLPFSFPGALGAGLVRAEVTAGVQGGDEAHSGGREGRLDGSEGSHWRARFCPSPPMYICPSPVLSAAPCGQVGLPQHLTSLLRGWVDLEADAGTSGGPPTGAFFLPPSVLVDPAPSGQCQGPAGAGRELGWGQQKVHKSLLAKTSALSRPVEAAAHGSGQGINHNSPTIDPFAAAIRKTVLVLSIF